jgi:hypothetical protein
MHLELALIMSCGGHCRVYPRDTTTGGNIRQIRDRLMNPAGEYFFHVGYSNRIRIIRDS